MERFWGGAEGMRKRTGDEELVSQVMVLSVRCEGKDGRSNPLYMLIHS